MEKKLILVSHGKLSEGMAYSVQMICGQNPDLSFYGMMPGEHYTEIVETIRRLATENPDTQYIIIADFLGGSVCNGCTELIVLPNVKLVSGMNLGLVVDFLFEPAPISDETIEKKIEVSRGQILNVTPAYLKQKDGDDSFF